MGERFEALFGAQFQHRDIVANPFLRDIRPYLRALKDLLRGESATSLAARMEREPGRASLYGRNAVQLREALAAIRQDWFRAAEGGATGRHPEDRREALLELEQVLAGMDQEAIEALPRMVELGVGDAENWDTTWYYPEINELATLLHGAYSSDEQAESSGGTEDRPAAPPDIRPILRGLRGVGDIEEEEWSPETLQWEIDEQVYETFSGMKVVDLFEGVMQYNIEYAGGMPGNSGTSLVYLCREDCLGGLLGGVSAICDALRGPAAQGEVKGKA